MIDQTSSSAFVDGRVPDGGKAIQGGFVWAFASLVTAAGLFGTMLMVSQDKEREAGRMLIDGQKGTPYLQTVFSSAATGLGRPNRY